MPSKKESFTLCFWQKASARPMMMQLTTISGMNTPRAALKKSEKKKKSAERAAKEAALQKEVEE